jgi:glycosyltransferase involved in cell wall biosynthesis
VPEGAVRPFWSVMIPAFNPSPDFFEQALEALLAQAPGREAMEIVVVDDGSASAAGRAVAERIAGDRVEWVARARGGIARNWNACIERARGHWIHILHQDDLLRPGFYTRLESGITSCPSAGAAFCRDVIIDAVGSELNAQPLLRDTPGVLENWIDHVFVSLKLRASALVVRRDVYEALGGFRLDLGYALDWDMWKRIAAAYPLWYEPSVLMAYRRHAASESFAFIRTGGNIAEIARSIELSEGLLPPSIAADVSRRTRENYTEHAVTVARRALRDRDVAASVAQLTEATKLTSTLGLLKAAGRMLRRAV